MKTKMTLKEAYRKVELKKHGGKIPKGEEKTESKKEKAAEIRAAKKLMSNSVKFRKGRK